MSAPEPRRTRRFLAPLALAVGLAAAAMAAELPGEPTEIQGTLAELSIGEHYLGAPATPDTLSGKVVLVEYGGL